MRLRSLGFLPHVGVGRDRVTQRGLPRQPVPSQHRRGRRSLGWPRDGSLSLRRDRLGVHTRSLSPGDRRVHRRATPPPTTYSVSVSSELTTVSSARLWS